MTSNIKSHIKSQQGFALITVLLITALVAIIASQLIYQQYADILRSKHMLHQAQSVAVANGLSSWVKTGLKADLENNQVDHLNEIWAQAMLPVPFAGGEVSGQLFDLQGRLNLNNLSVADENKRLVWQKIIKRFLIQQELDENLVDVIIDWIDADNQPEDFGAESDVYLLKEPAYRTANQLLVMPQELGLLQGFNRAIVTSIEQYIATLPEVTTINVNTASEKVLLGLADWMTEDIVSSWLELRKEDSVESVEDFKLFLIEQTQFEAEEINQSIPDFVLSTQTQYFLLVGQMDYGVVSQQVSAIIYRKDTENITLIQRWFSIGNE